MIEAGMALLQSPLVILGLILIVGAIVVDWWVAKGQQIDFMKPWRDRAPGDLKRRSK